MGMTREDLCFMAEICGRAEQFDDMLIYARAIVEQFGEELTKHERNLLSVALKNALGVRRCSWRALEEVEPYEESLSDNLSDQPVRQGEVLEMKKGLEFEKQREIFENLRQKVQTELCDLVGWMNYALDSRLLPSARRRAEDGDFQSAQSAVFFEKLRGDLCRVTSETQGSKKAALEATAEAYAAADATATRFLRPTDPVRLALALSRASFVHEAMAQPDKACQLAKKAFDEAVADLENIDEEQYKDAVTIMQLLRDNLAVWVAELDEKGHLHGL